MVSSSFTFLEQNLHALSHVYSQESIEVADHGGDDRKRDGLRDTMLTEVLSSECSNLQVEFDDERSVKALLVSCIARGAYTEDADENVGRNFKVMPVSIVRDLKQDQFASSERVHELSPSVAAFDSYVQIG